MGHFASGALAASTAVLPLCRRDVAQVMMRLPSAQGFRPHLMIHATAELGCAKLIHGATESHAGA
jgi:hypothetical protein